MDGKTKPSELNIVQPYNALYQEQDDSKEINEDRPLKGRMKL
jgi:hypothetical protein